MAEPTYNFPSVEETTNHPAYKGTVLEARASLIRPPCPWARAAAAPLQPLPGKCTANGPTKLILIMGLAGTIHVVADQTHTSWPPPRGPELGCSSSTTAASGGPTKPLGRVHGRAALRPDVLEVADHVGWTRPRQLKRRGHLRWAAWSRRSWRAWRRGACSRSRCCAPARASTAARRPPAPPSTAVAMLRPKTEARAIRDTALAIFPPAFPPEPPTACESPRPRARPCARPPTPRTASTRAFGSNFQRFQAQELHKRRSPGAFTLAGFACQLLAAAGHSKSPAQLRSMADAVGRERILVLHGTADKMLVVRNGERLARLVEPGVVMLVDDMGHAAHFREECVVFNGFMDESCALGRSCDGGFIMCAIFESIFDNMSYVITALILSSVAL
ncbi:hypothetical protein J3459_015797 [Metarhizium acridum]|nr:hypothetical protein J3459_015797 [Metarhizium acridum]